MIKLDRDYIDNLNKEIRRNEWLRMIYSFLNNKKRVNSTKETILELENKLILAKLKQAK